MLSEKDPRIGPKTAISRLDAAIKTDVITKDV
jgi:hypothetical protein